MPTVFITGPMTGIKDHNYPAFFDAENKLKAQGWDVENPASNPTPDDPTWENFMRLSIPQVCKSDVLVYLRGYQNSKGALMEMMVAGELGIPIHSLDGFLEGEL